MRQVALWIDLALRHLGDEARLDQIKEEIRAYLKAYPLPYEPVASLAEPVG